MIEVNDSSLLPLWDAAGFFRLLSCWLGGDLDDCADYGDFLLGMRPCRKEIGRTDDSPGVYILYFIQNGKFYIGSSGNIAFRVTRHHSLLRTNKHPNSKVLTAYHDCNGSLPQVLYIATRDEVVSRTVEQRLLDLVFLDSYCLNKRLMVDEYRPTTDEVRERIRDAAVRQWSRSGFREKIQEINKRPEEKARRVANANRKAEDPEFCAKLREATKKTWLNEEYVAKQRLSGAAVWNDDEFRERHSASMKAHWADPEYRARLAKRMLDAVASRHRPITINGVRYPNVQAAATALGMSYSTTRRKGIFDDE